MKSIESRSRGFHGPAMLAAFVGLWLGGGAEAAPLFFTDSASFVAASPVPLSVRMFEGIPPGTAVPEGTPFQGITYNANLGGLGLEVSNVFATTSGTQYLGVTDDQEFLSGHELTFTTGPLRAFGLFIISSPGDVLANDFQLVAPGGSIFNSGTPEQVLFDGREVFFLGVANTSTFDSAQLISFGDPAAPFFSFVIDDIATGDVPEPASLALIGGGLVLLALGTRKRRERFDARTKAVSAGVCMGTMLLLFAAPAQAIVYTASNEAAGNQVIALDVDGRGNPIEIGRFPTQGLGTGAPLGNQGALALDASDRWMFVVNSGDGSLTSFRLQPAGLQFVNRVASGGFRPLSVTVFGTLVYVLNEGDGVSADPNLRNDNISGFRFTGGGILVPVPNSTRIIATSPTAPAQIGFNKSGTVLLITEKATNTITTYVMQQDGTPAATPMKRPSAVPTPFGFAFGDRDFVFITEANGGGPGVTASYRVDRETGQVSSLVGLVNQGNATCWTVLSNDQTIGYSTNTASGTISLYRINFDGTVQFYFPSPSDTPIATGNGVRDAILTQNNDYLFTLNNGDSQIRGFFVNRSGTISPRGTVSVPASSTGLIAR